MGTLYYMIKNKFLSATAVCLLWPFLFSAQKNPELVVTSGHTGSVFSVAYHPNGKFLASGSEDHSVKIWDVSLLMEFRTLIGHLETVAKVVFSPDGHYLATKDRNEIIIWEFPSGKLLNRIKVIDWSGSLEFGCDSKTILTEGEDDKLVLLDALTGTQVREYNVGDPEMLAVDHNTKKIYSTCDDCEDNNDIAVFDFESGKQEKLLGGENGFTNKLFISRNGEYLGSFSLLGTFAVTLWDLATGKVTTKIELPSYYNNPCFSFSHDGATLVAGAYDTRIKLFQSADGKLIKDIKDFSDNSVLSSMPKSYKLGMGMWSLTASPDGKTFAAGLNYLDHSPEKSQNLNTIRFWNMKSGNYAGEIASAARFLFGLISPKSQNEFISGNINIEYGVKIWSVKDGSVRATEKIPGFFAWSEGMDTFTVFRMNKVAILDATDGYKELLSVPVKLMGGSGLSPDGKLAAIGNGDATKFPATKWIEIWDVVSKKKIKDVPVASTDGALRIIISRDKKYIVLCTEYQGMTTYEISTGKKVCDVKFKQYGKLICQPPGDGTVWVASLDLETNYNTPIVHIYDYITGAVKSEFSPEGIQGRIHQAAFSADGQFLAFGVGGFVYGTEFTAAVYRASDKKPVNKFLGHFGDVTHVCFSGDSKTLFSASMDGTIKAWNVSEQKERGTFIGMLNEDYLIFTPENYYKSSKGNYKGVCFRLKDRLYTFDQFDLQYNRPDIVMDGLAAPKSLVMMYKLAWKKRISRAGFSEESLTGDLHLPEIEIPGKDQIPASTDKPTIAFDLKASDAVLNLDRIQVYVNDVPAKGAKGISLRDKGVKSFQQNIQVDLSTGKNLVQVFSVNEKGLESLKESFEIECKKPFAKPNLYILAVGVAKYADKGHDLKYSTKDLNDFVAMMKTSGSYSSITVKKLVDSAATKENVLKEGSVFGLAGVDDQLIVYFSCHGLLDEKLDYYLAMHDVDFNDPSMKGLPYDEIENMLDKSICRNRLVLIDACHSGELDKDEVDISGNTDHVVKNTKSGGLAIKPKAGLKNSFAYMQALFADVSKGSGAVVISAAAGSEFALESGEWNNGVFTYAMLNGIKSGSADFNKDGVVSISELKSHVIQQVAILTKGAQVPTVRKENYYNDFIFYKR